METSKHIEQEPSSLPDPALADHIEIGKTPKPIEVTPAQKQYLDDFVEFVVKKQLKFSHSISKNYEQQLEGSEKIDLSQENQNSAYIFRFLVIAEVCEALNLQIPIEHFLIIAKGFKGTHSQLVYHLLEVAVDYQTPVK